MNEMIVQHHDRIAERKKKEQLITKQTRRFGGNSIAYTQKIIDQILDADLEINDFDPDRDMQFLE